MKTKKRFILGNRYIKYTATYDYNTDLKLWLTAEPSCQGISSGLGRSEMSL